MTQEHEEKRSIGMDDILKYIGELGLYQKLLLLWMTPLGIYICFVYFVQIFVAATPQNHWCSVPQLAHLDVELRRNLTAPYTEGSLERCVMFNANWSEVLLNLTVPPDTPTVPCQHGWEYLRTDIPYETVVTERDWVCDKASYVPLAQSVFFAGSFLGGIVFGWMADTYGRVPAIFGTNMVAFIGGLATIYTTGLWDFMLSRFIVGLGYDGCFMIIYILVLEYVGPKYRTPVANVSVAFAFGASAMLLPWLALWAADWRKLLWVTTLPMILIVLIPFTVPESARWLLSRGRVNKTVKVLKRFEKINRKKIPVDVMEDFIASATKEGSSNKNLIDLFKNPPLRKAMLMLMVLYMSCALIFDGLIRVSQNLGVDFFLTFTLGSATEIPALLLVAVILDRWGRKKMTFYSFGSAGILILIACFCPKGLPQMIPAIAARFLLNMAFSTATQWCTEIVPTEVRASGVGFLHITSYVAIFVSPFVVYSEQIWSRLPLVILSALTLFSASLAMVLPETNGLDLPQTIEEWERKFSKNTVYSKANVDVEKNEDIKKEKALIN